MTTPLPHQYWARSVWHTGRVPKVLLPACGVYQVSNLQRLTHHHNVSRRVVNYLSFMTEAYLGDTYAQPEEASIMADPVLVLEQEQPLRKLPVVFSICGTWDPLICETRRLDAALRQVGAISETRYYERGTHIFHFYVWNAKARRAWRDMFEFLRERLH